MSLLAKDFTLKTKVLNLLYSLAAKNGLSREQIAQDLKDFADGILKGEYLDSGILKRAQNSQKSLEDFMASKT